MNDKLCNGFLPKFIRYEIAHKLSIDDILRLCQTNKQCRKICSDEIFWKSHFSQISWNFIKETLPENMPIWKWIKYITKYHLLYKSIQQLLSSGIDLHQPSIVLYALNHGAQIKPNVVRLTVGQDDLTILKLLVKYGANLNDPVLNNIAINHKNDHILYYLEQHQT